MNIAKSYRDWVIDSEVFFENNRSYVYVINPKTNKPKKIRVYSNSEYKRLYPEEEVSNVMTFKTQKEVLGFEKGYITIFKGNTFPYKDWFKENGATFTRHWGWSFASDKGLPQDIPNGICPIQLKWENVGNAEGILYNDDCVKEAVENLIFDKGNSKYIGTIGERLDLCLTIKKIISTKGYYGISHLHIMEDEEGNSFVWSTSSRKLEEDEIYQMKGTVKEHKMYKNNEQTVLTRCAIIERR